MSQGSDDRSRDSQEDGIDSRDDSQASTDQATDDSADDIVLIDGLPVKLRGDGSVDDDDYVLVNGAPIKLRGDGSIDDSQEICSDSDDDVIGSFLDDRIRGLAGADQLRGLAGADDLFGDDGDDIIGGGDGDDALDGGLGRDALIGGFGSNLFRDCADGSRDRIRIRSDQWVVNPLLGSAGNNGDGQRADLIEELDRRDRVVIVGVRTRRLRFERVATTLQGVAYEGIGIYAKGALEAIYLGDDLNRRQLQQITSGELA